MKIGIIGSGRIGGTIAGRLSSSGHEVTIANSRGPETLRDFAAEIGASAAYVDDAAQDADVVITSVPFPRLSSLRDMFSRVPRNVVVIDTSNYFSFKDGVIPAVENGQVESEWVQEQLERPVVKAWNNILAGSFATKATPSGTAGRIALAVSGDVPESKAMAMGLVDATGFDPVDAGGIADSWRQQPGTPAYCTDLTADRLRAAIAAADRATMAGKRDRMVAEMLKQSESPGNEELLRLSRKHYLHQ